MLPLEVGLRYSSARKGHGFLSFMSWVSLLGLVLGVIALIVVVSVMNGFDRELKQRILGAVPHVVVEPASQAVENWLAARPEVTGTARFARREGVVVHQSINRVVSLYGIEPDAEEKVSVLPAHVVAGELSRLTPGSNHVLLGRSLAFQMGVRQGDVMTVIVPEPSAGGKTVRPRMTRVTVQGFFELDSPLDYSLVIMHVSDLTSLVDASPMLRARVDDIFAAPRVAAAATAAGGATSASDWTAEFGDFFETVKMEKTMMFVLLTLVVGIAAFNIVSSLSMMVKEKQADIAVFRTMGLGPADVMLVFITQGAMVGVLGVCVGLAAGLPLAFFVPDIVAFFEALFGARMLAGTYFDKLPVDIRPGDIAVIAAVAFLISLLATVYPAWRAARLRPASVLRYE